MTFLKRAALPLAAALALSACATVREWTSPAPAPIAAPAVPALAPGQWPQAVSDIPADPNVRFGALPNGMRYAIQKNATPPGQAALRLRFDAGSLMETDAQAGLAHFLEHMAFNGSKAIPEGEMVKILERHGLAFGADTNASTSWTETVYKLDLPQTDAATVDDSLKLLRETASELTIAPEAVERERGVVLSEERGRDSPGYRVFKSRLAFVLKGQLPPRRMPIGQVEVLKTAPASELRDFYAKYYRPERAVLVAVGDFDVDVMEAKIKAAFSDWTAPTPAGPEPDLGAPAQRGLETLVVEEPGSPTTLQFAWTSLPDLRPDTRAKRKSDWLERLGFAVLNRRLERVARAGEPPFLAAGVFGGDQFDAADVTTLAVTARGNDWKAALSATEREQRRAAEHGVRQDELDREIAEMRTLLKAEVAAAATRRTPSLASGIAATLEDDEVVTSPAQDLELFEEAVKDLKAEQVSAALKASFAGSGPLVFLSTPVPVEGNDQAVAAALATSRAVAVTAPEAPRQVVWPYASFGAPGKVVEQRDITDLDTVMVRFENGVRLTVKPTRFRDDQVLVKVRIGEGNRELSANIQSLSWAATALIEGGLAQISTEDMERVLASNLYGANFSVEDAAFVLSGSTRPEDLDVQLQVLTAYAAEPGWRGEAFERLRTYAATLHDQYEATDEGVFSRDLPGLLHRGDRRWTFPSRQEIATTTLADMQGQFGQALASGRIEVIIVGDTTVEKAIAAVSRTLGALPPRRAEPPLADSIGVALPDPSPAPVVLTHNGRADQAIGYLAWKTGDFLSDLRRTRTLQVLAEVLDLRLTDEMREAQGATYSPQVGYSASQVWNGWGYISARVEVPPALIDGFFRDVAKIAADLRDTPVTADELERARKPRLEQIAKARHTNEYWLSELSWAQEDPRKLESIRSVTALTERVTAADLQAAARQYLQDERAWKLVVKPK